MIGKEIEKLEKENKFCWYVEFKPKKMFGFDLEEHNKLMNAFIGFLPKDNIKILRLNDEIVEDVFELNYDEILENIKLLSEEKGKFYDEDDDREIQKAIADLAKSVKQIKKKNWA